MPNRPHPALVTTLSALAWAHSAAAQQAPAAQIPDVTVISTTPLLGSGTDAANVPAATQVLTPAQIDRTNIPSLTGAILDFIPSATVNETSGNDFQPDLLFRGFTASPVAGTAEGLAVYVNGARFNDPFGDTVNWDLIPSIAIDTVNIEAANPVFGLNALGGSVNVQMKNGFTFHGGDLTAYGGSYGRGAGLLEYGQQSGDMAIYGAGEIIADQGFRQTQASNIYRLYTDLGYRTGQAEVHLSIDAADNTLGNPGASPEQELNADLSGIFTGPNEVYNKYVAVNLNGSYAVSDDISLQALAYYQTLTQRISNGATSDTQACGDGIDALCNDDGSFATTTGGAIIPDFLNGATYSNLVLEGLDTHAYGASLQATVDAPIAGHANHLVIGASYDGSNSTFNADTLIGGFTTDGSQLFVGPPDYVQVQPDEGINPVKVATTTRYFGLFFSDLFTIVPGLDLTLNGRFNNAEVDSSDQLGEVLNGQHSFNRFNPGAGLTWHVTPNAQIYASYAEANRVPTPQELSCSSAATPCSLLNFFIGDPNLKQVVARTVEAGIRGKIAHLDGGTLGWNADYYHTQDQNDLIFETDLNNPNLAYFTNAGKTLRQGVEAELTFDTPRLHATLGYAYTRATFQSPLLLGSASNPFADENGNIQVSNGDRIPGIPEHRGTAALEYKLTDWWSVGGSSILTSSQYRFGDESNQTKPLGGYVLLNLDTSFKITDNITIFGVINNITNQRYDTYGTFGPTDQVPFPNTPGGVTNTQTADPGQPLSGYGGVRVRF